MNCQKIVTSFISEARNKGFSDMQIKQALLNKNYPEKMINYGFEKLQPKFKLKNQICIFLSSEMLRKLETRADKNMFTLGEQIEDILRRSCTKKGTLKEEKLDDTFIKLFSRKQK